MLHCVLLHCVTLCYTALRCVALSYSHCAGEVRAPRSHPGSDLWVLVHRAGGIPEEICRLPGTAGEVGVVVLINVVPLWFVLGMMFPYPFHSAHLSDLH